LRRLIELGHRPGAIAGRSVDELQQMLPNETAAMAANLSSPETYLPILSHASPIELRRRLRSALVRQGLAHFILATLVPLTRRVGEWRAERRIEVYQEHLFTAEVERLLREAMTPLDEYRPTKIILTTLPSESHNLGLLMTEALLRLEGAACLPMGTATPPDQIVRLVRQAKAHVVALSFSAAYVDPLGYRQLAGLRRDLPAHVALWIGGAGARRVARNIPGVDVIELNGLTTALRQISDR
jgi:methylmalonyl-CoA mutase cobalamin-binding subunit